ncbi:MAG: tetratricopeptide repeat protein [Candidatus Latescibacteria bacterium]|nr:tetratricopeptide repeat protein [Candidatus Latescibacterota bacterium]
MRSFLICILTGVIVLAGCASNKYNSGIKQAEIFIRARQYDKAEYQLKNLIKAYPQNPEPYYLYGLVHYSTENYYECLINFDKAERYGYNRPENMYLQKGVALYHTGNREEADKNLSLSLERNQTPLAQKYLGIVRFESNDYSGATEPLKKAVVSFPDDSRINHYLGVALFKEGNTVESLKYSKKALMLDPNNLDLVFQTANLMMLDEQYNDAIELYNSIPVDSYYSEKSLYNSSEAYIKLGEYNSALQLLKYLFEKNPNDYNIRYNLSAVMIQTENYSDALDILLGLYNTNRDNPHVAYNLGLVYQKLAQTDMSTQFYDLAVSIEPLNAQFRYAYGFILGISGKTREAARQMEAAVKILPDYTDARNWLDNYRKNTFPN